MWPRLAFSLSSSCLSLPQAYTKVTGARCLKYLISQGNCFCFNPNKIQYFLSQVQWLSPIILTVKRIQHSWRIKSSRPTLITTVKLASNKQTNKQTRTYGGNPYNTLCFFSKRQTLGPTCLQESFLCCFCFYFGLVSLRRKIKERQARGGGWSSCPFHPRSSCWAHQSSGWQWWLGFRGLFSLYKTLKARALPDSKLYKTIILLLYDITLLPLSFFLTPIIDSRVL